MIIREALEEENNYASITVRVPFSMIKFIAEEVQAKRAKSKSEVVRDYFEDGKTLRSLMQTYNDPAKKAEFEKKFKALMSKQDVERTLASWEPAELDTIIHFAKNQKDNKFKQLLLDVQSVKKQR